MRRTSCSAALVLVLAIGCGGTQTAALGPASDFRLRTTEGDTFQLGDHLGSKVIVLSFWTTFCPSCRAELTQMQNLYEQLADEGLLVVAVSLDPPETVPEVRPVAERLGFTFPVVIDTESVVTGLYNPRGATPFTVMIDGQRRRVWAHEGFVPGDVPDLEARIRGLLAELSSEAHGEEPAGEEPPGEEPAGEEPPGEASSGADPAGDGPSEDPPADAAAEDDGAS